MMKQRREVQNLRIAPARGKSDVFREIVEKSYSGILIVDRKGTVQFINPAAEVLFNRPAEQFIGQTFGLPLKPDRYVEIDVLGPDKTRGIAEMRVSETVWNDQPARLVFLHDITERNHLEARLKEAKKAAEGASQAKSEFLANMSHELRSPLNSLLLLAQDLVKNKNGNLLKNQIESLEIIYKSGHELMRLINDILDLAKIEAGKMPVYIRETSLAELANNVKLIFTHVAQNKGLELKINICDSLPGSILTDFHRIEQIIINLVSNAVKFTSDGCIRIDFHRPSFDAWLSGSPLDPAKTVAFAVTDTGIGIPADKQNEIFEAFTQADGSTSRQYDGTGLGLSICKDLARLLGGEIRLKSVEGKGSTFTLYVPEALKESKTIRKDRRSTQRTDSEPLVAGSGRQETAKNIPAVKDVALEGKTVLVTDDNMRNLFVMTKILEDSGMKTYKAVNGKNALEMLEQKPAIDLVLMDIMMPDMNGYETIASIRSQEKFKQLPIIAVTARAMRDDYKKCISAGADDYIAKPVDIEKLFSIMQQLI